MIVLALTLLLASLTSCQDATDPTTAPPSPPTCKDHDHAEEGCAPLPYICQISCDAEGCTLANDETEVDSCETALVTMAPSEMSEATCTQQCALSKETSDTTTRCRFWRYDASGTSKVCTLMSEEQCMIWDECISEGGHGCKMGDQGCPGDTEPEPARRDCEGPINFDGKRHIHWTCRDANGDHLSAYSPQEVIPDGALCTTNHKCFDWKETPTAGNEGLTNKLQVTCANGVWKADNGTAGTPEQYEPVLNGEAETDKAIQEPTCTGGTAILKIPKANIADEEAAELICETPADADTDPDSYTINAPNSCILLCNSMLGWTIDSYLRDDDGVEVFVDDKNNPFTYEDEPTHIQDGSIVKCW